MWNGRWRGCLEHAARRERGGSIECFTTFFTKSCFPYVSPFRVFHYTTFRTALASLTALFLCIALGPWLIAKLREFQIGQHIREDGPQSHQKKAGTPTMGGVLIVISIVIPTLLWANLRQSYVWVALFGLVTLRRHRLLGRLHQGHEEAQSGADGAQQVRAASAGGVRAGGVLLALNARGLYTTNINVPFFKNFKPDLLIHALLMQPLALSAGVRAILLVSWRSCWWARRTR